MDNKVEWWEIREALGEALGLILGTVLLIAVVVGGIWGIGRLIGASGSTCENEVADNFGTLHCYDKR